MWSPVAAGVVDERDAERVGERGGQITRVGLAEGIAPEAAERLEEPADAPRCPGAATAVMYSPGSKYEACEPAPA